MKANSFRRKGNSWYKTTAECIVVFNLQHSLYGKMFYINLAALLRKGDDLLFPKEYQCDIRMRFPIMEIEGYSTQMILKYHKYFNTHFAKIRINRWDN